MAVRLLVLGALVALLARCGGGGGDDGGGKQEQEHHEDFARRARAFSEELRSPLPPYALRYPSTLERVTHGRPPAPVVLRRASDGATCTVTAAGPLPDVAREGELEDYLEQPPGGPARPPADEVRAEEGDDEVDGASVLRQLPGGKRTAFEGVVQTAGRGVALSCDAPRAKAEDFDARIFRPMLASVRLAPDSGLERLQRNLLVIPGVNRASLLRRSPRRVTGIVDLSPNISGATALRQAMARALLTVADNLPTDRVRLTGL